ncbi:MAG: DoxX family protein [Bacteriovoracaceae bacterium]|nr:DoxX family protein [Bacteriovoracaceae bacterium]
MKKMEWILALISSVILLQTLAFKFTAAPESVWIFSTLGMEPWGRIGSGIMELIAGVCLLVPALRMWGALLTVGVMSGAILSHFFVLGIAVQDDGGLLFTLALICFFSSLVIVYLQRKNIPYLKTFFILLLLPTIGFAKPSYNTESKFGIHGYDPVSYLTGKKAVEGKVGIVFEYDGIKYLFSSEDNKATFIKEPMKYIPAYGGWCAYAMANEDKVDVDPETFKIIDGKTYLFYNGFYGDTLKKWNAEGEDKLKPKADAYYQKITK